MFRLNVHGCLKRAHSTKPIVQQQCEKRVDFEGALSNGTDNFISLASVLYVEGLTDCNRNRHVAVLSTALRLVLIFELFSQIELNLKESNSTGKV
jgi:hypothetical protein